MSKLIQRNMAAGEINPDLNARSGLVSYKTGLSTCRNFYVKRFGSVTRRPGTEFVAEVKDSSKLTRLIEFEFSNNDTLILEFGEFYVRVHREGETILADSILDPLNITAVENTINPIFSTTDTVIVGREIVLNSIFLDGDNNEQGAISNRNFIVSEVVPGGFRVVDLFGNQIDTTGFGTFNAALSRSDFIFEIATPFTESELFDIRFSQSADVLSLTHFDRGVFNLSRRADNAWDLNQTFFQPSLNVPITANFELTADPDPNVVTGPFNYRYIVTTIDAATGEESTGTSFDVTMTQLVTDPDAFIVINFESPSFTNASGTQIAAFNVYRSFFFLDATGSGQPPIATDFSTSGVIATVIPRQEFSGGNVTFSGTFTDDGTLAPDFSRRPPGPDFVYGSVLNPQTVVSDILSATSGLHPTAITTSKGRRFVAGSLRAPEDVYGSAISRFDDFSSPTAGAALATSAVNFQVTSEKVGRVLHLLDYKRLMVFTENAEFVAQGGENGNISGTGLPNSEKIGEDGIGKLRPLIADKNVLYVQARGSLVKFIGGSITIDDYQGNELSILSAHLVDGFEIVDWAYQRVPHGIVWAARSDGTLLSMTYNPAHSLNGWARHDFLGGKVESVANVPEGNSDKTYVIVNRTINGQTKRYIESFNTEDIRDIEENKLMDSHLSFDGRNTDGNRTITLSAADYTRPNLITLTSSDLFLSPITSRVGESIFISVGDDEVRFDILEQVSGANSVRAIANKDVPASIQDITTNNWSHGIKRITGLHHLEGESLAILSGGFVSASPLNEEYDLVTVTNGEVSIDIASDIIHAGLPMISDLGTLDVDTEGRQNSLDNVSLLPQYISLKVRDSASFFAGENLPSDSTPLAGLREAKVRRFEDYDEPNSLRDDVVELNIESNYERGGRVFIRQVDPLPLTVLSIGVDGRF